MGQNKHVLINSIVLLFLRNICVLPTHDVGRERYLTLLGALHTVDPKFGYRFLFFLKARLAQSQLNLYLFICY